MTDETSLIDKLGPHATSILAIGGLVAGGYRALKGIYMWISATHEVISKLDTITAQLEKNGGSSMRDALDRIEEKQEAMHKTLTSHEEKIELMINQMNDWRKEKH